MKTPRVLTVRFTPEQRRRIDEMGEYSGHEDVGDVLAAALQLYEFMLREHEEEDVNFFRQMPGGPLVPLDAFTKLPNGPYRLVAGYEPPEGEE